MLQHIVDIFITGKFKSLLLHSTTGSYSEPPKIAPTNFSVESIEMKLFPALFSVLGLTTTPYFMPQAG